MEGQVNCLKLIIKVYDNEILLSKIKNKKKEYKLKSQNIIK